MSKSITVKILSIRKTPTYIHKALKASGRNLRLAIKSDMGHMNRFFSIYLVDFVWRREFNGRDVMYHLWSQIAEIYPVEN